ncbi:ATP-binding protein [Streptomyces sp. cmx-4-9]|uniref:ATP-binding protein n=1 Tax=Streptomyces sp. cmx-4-9 TaxID=2790941 RepID=UPI003980273C
MLSQFRTDFYGCLTGRSDALFELTDALLCTEGPVKTLVDLALAPEHRRGHGALYGGLNQGRIDFGRLRRALAGLPLPRAADGRLVLVVDVSPWLRPDAATCHTLAGSEWIRKSQPFCLIGDSGTGKSHMLIALGTEAAMAGYRVKYVLATKLVNELVEAADEKQLAKRIARYGRVGLFCIDELGYMELDRRGAELLFPVLTEREEKNSVAIASNESFGKAHMFRSTCARQRRWSTGSGGSGCRVGPVRAPERPEGFELGAGEVFAPLAAIAALAVFRGDFVEAADHRSCHGVDALLGRPGLGAGVVVLGAIG